MHTFQVYNPKFSQSEHSLTTIPIKKWNYAGTPKPSPCSLPAPACALLSKSNHFPHLTIDCFAWFWSLCRWVMQDGALGSGLFCQMLCLGYYLMVYLLWLVHCHRCVECHCTITPSSPPLTSVNPDMPGFKHCLHHMVPVWFGINWEISGASISSSVKWE